MNIYRGRSATEFYLASTLYDSIEDLNISAVKSLITDKGADANIILPRKGISPFHLAIGSDNGQFALEITSLILQSGGDPNVRSDEGLTPLHIAAAWGRTELVKLLLHSGGDPDLQDNCYQTAADYATEEDHREITSIIREYLSTEALSFFMRRESKIGFQLTLDKVLVNNGQTVGEYKLSNEPEPPTIDLKVLPETNTNEYVLNWCKTIENTHLLETTKDIDEISLKKSDSFNLSSEDSTSGRLNFKNVTTFRTKTCQHKIRSELIMSEPKVIAQKEQPIHQEDFFKLSQESRESGIQTLPDSMHEYTNLDDYFVPKSVPATSPKVTFEKLKDASSDYCTCTDGSENAAFDQNIFEISSASSNKSVDISKGLNNAMIQITDSDLSFVSVSEVYKYIDVEEGVVLFEKKMILPLNGNVNETEHYTISSKSSIISKLSSLPRSFDYDTDTLRQELTQQGYDPGPITKTTKKVYLRKLYNLKKHPFDYQIVEDTTKKVYSNEIEKTIRNAEWSQDLTPYRELEDLVTKQFGNPDPNRKWREGVNKSSFTYLLLDPRISRNLPCRSDVMTEQEQWETFLSSIFYVGKGKRSRPYQHLYEAISLYNKNILETNNKKLQHIIDIWSENQGVVCLHVFQNVIPVEAYTREASMISALKLENVKNAKCGDFYGIAATWSPKQKRMFGVYLLYKAMRIFLNEGERQLSPSDID